MMTFYAPLEQFEIVFNHSNNFSNIFIEHSFFFKLFYSLTLFFDNLFYNLNISDWTISLFRIIFIYLLLFSLIYGLDKGAFIWPKKWQLFLEMIYNFLAGMFKEQVNYRGQKYFPFLATVFLFVLFLNLFGMIPYEGAITSQLIFNLSLSFMILVYLTIIGFSRQGLTFFKLFLPPAGVPTFLHPLIIFIEVISYFARGISLGVRLFANIMAGHTLLFIFSSFILKVNILLGITIFLVIFLVTFLEFFIATLQAYVFFVLVIIYFRDSIEVSH
jgi:F-type H+-transporting ATPase subunit a